MPSTSRQSAEDAEPLAKLPRGPHQLSTDEVRASQRARLINAMLELVGERGWSDTTVPQVVARARVSKNSFYELFDDKVACYLAAMDAEVGKLLEALREPGLTPDWRETLDRGMDIYLQWWIDRPGSARAYLVELPEAGARAIEQRERAYVALARVFDRLAQQIRAADPSLPAVPEIAIHAIVHTITEAVAAEVRHGRLDDLQSHGPELKWLVRKLLAGEAG